jgi:hypothetical protein
MFLKSWLCHGINAPVIEGSRSVFSVTERGYNGRLTVDTLLPHEDNLTITSIGDPADFDVFGEKYPAELYPDRRNEGGACRIMVSPKIAAERDRFLHVLQVSDADGSSMPTPLTLDGCGVCGTLVYGTAVLFTESDVTEISVTVPAGCERILLCGIDGTWNIGGTEMRVHTGEGMLEIPYTKEFRAVKV